MAEKKIIALGFFDGVHRGHGMLLSRCRSMADEMGCAAASVTFSAHPDELVLGSAPALINSDEERSYLMKTKYGIDEILVLPFDRKMMNMPWKDFFAMMVEDYAAAGIVCGHDFRFGVRGEGTAQLLQKYSEEKGIPCAVIPEQRCHGITISSTYIRQLLEQGNVEEAAEFLGHRHLITGTVVSGRKLGRTLGIPTANIMLGTNRVELKHGVYACKVRVGETLYMAVTNVGTRPTVNGHHLTVEPWILDFDGDLYGEKLSLSFHKFLRPEQKFPDLEQLKTAICRDAEHTRMYFDLLSRKTIEIPDII